MPTRLLFSFLFFGLWFQMPSHLAAQGSTEVYGLEFTENLGQWGQAFDFRAQVGTGAVFLHANGFTVLQHQEADYRRVMSRFFGHTHEEASQTPLGPEDSVMRSHLYRVYFEGASLGQPVAEGVIQTDINYFLGNDPSRWKSGVRSWASVTYRNLYPGIDLRYYTYNGDMKYDLIVHSGADPSCIRLRYEGVDGLSVKKGALQVRTSVGVVTEGEPYTYLAREGGRQEIDCRYQLSGNTVRFEVEDHDPAARMVIDPTLVFGTFTGSASDNYGYTATPGPDGSLFAGGIVFGTEYPVVPKPGAFQTAFKGGLVDIGITRFSPDGTARMYSTYIGGNGLDIPHSLIADGQGNLIILGRTNSSDYPVKGYLSPSRGNTDIVVTKLNATGRALIGSAVLGGSGMDGSNLSNDIVLSNAGLPLVYNYGDQSRSEVILDDAGNILFVSNTQSSNFPMINAAQPAFGGGIQDAVVVKMPPDLSGIYFSTFLGGSAEDAGFCIKTRPGSREIYVAGPTRSINFPGSKTGTIGSSFGGDVDGYIAVLSADGQVLLRSTYLSTPAIDIIFGLQFDKDGFPYVMGITLGNWPVIGAPAQFPGSKQFVAKLQPDLSAYVFSTVFGSPGAAKPNISPVAFLVDRCERIYISGWGGRLGENCFPVATGALASRTLGPVGMPITSDAIQGSGETDNSDFYIIVLERNAASVLYGTFVGQVGGYGDHVDGGTSRFDARGVIYQSACANCGGNTYCPSKPITRRFPTTPGAVAAVPSFSATTKKCNLAAFKIELPFTGVSADLEVSAEGNFGDTTGCVPLDVLFTDEIGSGKTYEWDFGDGSPRLTTTVPEARHLYTRVGRFRVSVTAIDASKCIARDSSIRFVIVSNDKAILGFLANKLLPCSVLRYQFSNTSTAPPGRTFSANAFIWDFGDGTRLTTNAATLPPHTYAAPGTYIVKLIMRDLSFCNGPDSVSQVLRVSDFIRARLKSEDTVCQNQPIQFDNTSLGGSGFVWTFGDGTSFIGPVPPDKVYTSPGRFLVTLVASDPNACNLTDDTTKFVVVLPSPRAAFTYSPNPSVLNTPTVFSNNSIAATKYNWDFGDGNTSANTNPTYAFIATARNNVCLTAKNSLGCADTTCQIIPSLVSPLVDVPNAFTPNGDGNNDQVFVRGFGIAKMDFRIYNRWGQMVFRSQNINSGWDGYYLSRLQPMDVYAYFLEVEFSTGEKVSRKGDITLLR